MKYIALLRGINVGGNRKVEMKRLKSLFDSQGYTNVITYLNSGNVIFESEEKQDHLQERIPALLAQEFGFEIKTLIKSDKEIQKIAKAIPDERENNKEQKTDIAYLFPEIDSEETIDKLAVKKEYIDIKYSKGALIWNVKKEDYNKSQLNKIVGQKYYKLMTIRNVNTARFLAGKKK